MGQIGRYRELIRISHIQSSSGNSSWHLWQEEGVVGGSDAVFDGRDIRLRG